MMHSYVFVNSILHQVLGHEASKLCSRILAYPILGKPIDHSRHISCKEHCVTIMNFLSSYKHLPIRPSPETNLHCQALPLLPLPKL